MKKQIKNKVISIFRKFFPEPTEDELLARTFKLLNSLKSFERKIKDQERYEDFRDTIDFCERLIERVKFTPHGKRKPLLKMTVAFIRLNKTLYFYNQN